MAWPGTARQRVLRAKATKAKNKMPPVNFERSAPARLRANIMVFFRLGFCHVSAKLHNVSKENSDRQVGMDERAKSEKGRCTDIDAQAKQPAPVASQAPRVCV